MTTPVVTITVHEVGDKFAECAIVRKNGKKLYRTREYPYGYGSQAFENARRWALEAGYAIRLFEGSLS